MKAQHYRDMLFPGKMTLKAILAEPHIIVVYLRPPEVETVINSHIYHEKIGIYYMSCNPPEK